MIHVSDRDKGRPRNAAIFGRPYLWRTCPLALLTVEQDIGVGSGLRRREPSETQGCLRHLLLRQELPGWNRRLRRGNRDVKE